MSAIPGWYEDPTKAHERRYWNGAVWTDDVIDHDVGTKSARDVALLPAPEVAVVERNVESSAPTAVAAGAPPGDGMHVGVWIALAVLGLGFLAVVATANSHRMHFWFEGGVFIAAIVLVAFVVLMAGLLMTDHHPAEKPRASSPKSSRRSLRRRSPQALEQGATWSAQESDQNDGAVPSS